MDLAVISAKFHDIIDVLYESNFGSILINDDKHIRLIQDFISEKGIENMIPCEMRRAISDDEVFDFFDEFILSDGTVSIRLTSTPFFIEYYAGEVDYSAIETIVDVRLNDPVFRGTLDIYRDNGTVKAEIWFHVPAQEVTVHMANAKDDTFDVFENPEVSDVSLILAALRSLCPGHPMVSGNVSVPLIVPQIE